MSTIPVVPTGASQREAKRSDLFLRHQGQKRSLDCATLWVASLGRT